MAEPSEHYRRCLEEATRHHATSKTYTGKFVRPHAPFIKEIVERLGCKSILDYGAGKGEQYQWVMPNRGVTLEEFWGVPVTKYDPAWPAYAAEPTGQFDLVICTHTLGAIPKTDLGWVIDRLHGLGRKALYIAEKIGPMRKRVFSQPDLMPIGWTPAQWRETIHRQTGLEVTLSTREKRPEGVIMEHWRHTGGDWQRFVWPEGMQAFNHKTA